MTRIISTLLITTAIAVLAALPGGGPLLDSDPAYAASGATYFAPPNHSFEAAPKYVGGGPTNYDFASGGSGWTKLGGGTATYTGGVATLSGSVQITSSSYTATDDVQAIKVRYKFGASASVSVLKGGVGVGSDNLDCVDCTTGEWVEKYIGIYTSAQGESIKVRFLQSSGTTEIDWAGTQWIPFQEWTHGSTGPKSQPKQGEEGSQIMEVRGNAFSGEFYLPRNRLELHYAFPKEGDNSLIVYLRRASDGNVLDAETFEAEGDPVPSAVGIMTWSQNYVPELVYLQLQSSASQPSWVDNVGMNFMEAGSKADFPAIKCCDPFDTSSGQFTHSHTDVLVPGKGVPLEFTRFYHSMVSTTRDLGHNWRHTYSTYLRIDSDESVTVYYGSGGAAFFEEDGGSYTPPDGVFDTLVKNQDDTYTLTTVSLVDYNFSSAGKLTSIADRTGNTTTISYDGNGFLSEVEDAGGRTLTFTVDGSGRITAIEDPLERTVGFEYDGNGDLVEVADVKGGTATYTYSNHRMTSLTDSNGHLQNENIYDSANRVVEQTDALGGVTCVYYGAAPAYTSSNCAGASPSPAEGETIVVDPNGSKTTYGFDTSFRTTDIEDDLGNGVHYDYDAENNVTCVADQLGNKTAYDYDSNGNVTQIIDAENADANCALEQGGVDWEFTYTASNDIDLATDTLGRQTDYVYDDGNLTEIIRKDDQSNVVSRMCFTPDGDGLVTEVIESTNLTGCTGNTTLLDYDTYGNQTEVVSPRFSGQQDPPVATLTYDLGGRLETATNALDETATYTYDQQNNVLTVEDNLGNTTSKTYDAKGNLETVTDANRQAVSTPESGAACGTAGTGDGDDDDSDTVVDDGCPAAIYVYDDADRLIEVIDALGSSTTYAYDDIGNRTSVTNANRQPVSAAESGAACGTAGTGDGDDDDSDTVVDDGCPSMIYAYDEVNRLESEADALGRTTGYGYDEAGNLIERTDARDLVTAYEYDALNRLVLVEHWDGETLVDDVDYTYDDVGNRLTMIDDTGTTEYEYDDLDRPTSVTFPGDDTVAYEYDDLPGGSAADYPGQRTLLTYPDSKDVEYTYDEAGNLETVTDWLNNTTTYVYDDAGRLSDTDLPNGVDSDYTYDSASRLESVVNTDPTPSTISSFDYTLDSVGNRVEMEDMDGTHSYEYDPLYRLTEVTYPDQATDDYTYDAVGNRLTRETGDYTYDAADQLTDLEGTSYDYDDNGNQIERGTDTFDYDHENRLVESVIDSVTSTSTYNGDGLRMSHTVGQTTTSYIWDATSGLPVVLQDGTNTYVYGLDLISASDDQDAQTYFLYDGLGSVTDLTDDEGDVVDGYTYDVFGAIRSQSGSSDSYWLFTGEQSDSDEGLYYLRARYYDPQSGRFLGKDPVPFVNRYAYVGSNPVNYVDPSGLCGLGSLGDALDCGRDFGECTLLNGFDCVDPRQAADPLIDLLPEGSFEILGMNVSYQLAATCFQYPEACAAAGHAMIEAQSLTFALYGKTPEGTSESPKEGDAFQHCFWSGLITLAVGAGRAENVTTRYEAVAGNDPDQRDYDIHNNKRGREFAQYLRASPNPWSRAAQEASLTGYCR